MAYEERASKTQHAHSVIMEGRARLAISGVEDVASFDEQEIVMVTSAGNLAVHGSELHIDKLDLENGDLTISGTVGDLIYEETQRSGSLWTRLFG